MRSNRKILFNEERVGKMASKEIYNNGNSKCVVEYDGEVIAITQEVAGEGTHNVFLYEDEIQQITEFIASVKKSSWNKERYCAKRREGK